MSSLTQAVRVSLLAITLAATGCVVETDDDADLGIDESSVVDENTVVDEGDGTTTVTVDVVECRKQCDTARTQCSVTCTNDNVCIGSCDSKKTECYTTCD